MVTSSNRSRSIRRRRQQRGASVLIVFLVMAMLTGIGMFAARSSTLATAVAGSSKQLLQTRYMSEYATMNATSSLALDPQRYVLRMQSYAPIQNDPKCYGMELVPNATCCPLGLQQLEAEAGVPLVTPADLVNKVPGGLGLANLDADLYIDLTDYAPASPPVAGEALNAESPVKLGYKSITVTAHAQVRPLVGAANQKQNLATSASVQTWRAHVVTGPLPDPPKLPPVL